MVNKALYVTEMKNSWKLLLIFCLILTMYTTIMLTMFDPSLGSALDEFAKMMPRDEKRDGLCICEDSRFKENN